MLKIFNKFRKKDKIPGPQQSELIDDPDKIDSLLDISYKLLPNGTTNINISLCENMENTPEVLGAMLAHINNGTCAPQVKQILFHAFDFNFATKVLEAWEIIDTLYKDIPMVKPSDVGRMNMPFQSMNDGE